MNFLVHNKIKRASGFHMSSPLPRKIYMRRIITRSMHRKFAPHVTVIQRAWRQCQKYWGVKDPLTLGPLERPVFNTVDANGFEQLFSAIPLAMYILNSGDYRNPMTRVEFSTVEIMRLVRLSGVEGILNVAECKQNRANQLATNSLRTFFEEELVNSIDTFFEYSRQNPIINTGYLIRHMMALVFPNILVTIVRACRIDPEFVDELFVILNGRHDAMCQYFTRPNSPGRTVTMIFEQFIADIQRQVEDGTLTSGTSADINVGGFSLSIDLRAV